MKIFKFLCLSGILALVSFSCSNSRTPEVVFAGAHADANGDTLNKMSEKGKQGLWRYKDADGTTTDTVYRDGVAQ